MNNVEHHGIIGAILRFCLNNALVMALLVVAIVVWGVMVAPFDWKLDFMPRDPVPVDAIPDIGENQQIVFTEWSGRSPQDVEDQITYPLTIALLGTPHVKTIRSYSYFGFSTIYVIFDESADFYWTRSRLLEKLNALPENTLPPSVTPKLGPDATALGQVYWYTLEGRDTSGAPTGGWDLHELRTIQDWTVRYALQSAEGVAEVASVGGYVKEYQVDVNPNALRQYGITLEEVIHAVQKSNLDVGARTMEINRVEYMLRGVGYIKSLNDLRNSVVTSRDGIPVTVGDVATVTFGPEQRRGVLDKAGAEVVGGVVVTRFGANPLETINNVKSVISEISPGLPKKTLADGRTSQVTIVPFYDRTNLIYETLGTLNKALIDEILITIIVVIVILAHLRSSLLISAMLPLTVAMVFIGMKILHVDANIVALSGIAIAIGTIVDMGIVMTESIVRHLHDAPRDEPRLSVIFRASHQVGGAVLTAVATTVISFLPVFTLGGAEGKLFTPLAYTKTFALIGSIIIALTVIPAAARFVLITKDSVQKPRSLTLMLLLSASVVGALALQLWLTAVALLAVTIWVHFKSKLSPSIQNFVTKYGAYIVGALVAWPMSLHWRMLGFGVPAFLNYLVTLVMLGLVMFIILSFLKNYEKLLRWCLSHRAVFLSICAIVTANGLIIWQGFDRVFGFMPQFVRSSKTYVALNHLYPGLGQEFMPALDEGAFLYMPSTMPHASVAVALDVLQKQDMAIQSIPEVENVVGKIGRVDSPLDPAPISMIETVIQYKSEYKQDQDGDVLRFKYDNNADSFFRDTSGELIPDADGKPYRQWREHIHSPQDIWDEIIAAGQLPGVTSAPKLQPIETRLVMLQSGMRAPMGIKVKGPDLKTIETTALELETLMKSAPGVEPATVLADRVVGTPYLEIHFDRGKLAQYGITIGDAQETVEVALGGKALSVSVEGRERYPIRVRYARELRDNPEALKNILFTSSNGAQIPLAQIATVEYSRGPMVIKSEDTFLTAYVIFDKLPGWAEVNVVEEVEAYLKHKMQSGEFTLPANVSYSFAGTYEQQVRAEKKFAVVLPLALFLIFLILYFQFREVSLTALVFAGVFLAWSGGFMALWLYGQDWFLNVSILGIDFREVFQIRPYNLSVAVWVGFLALFGIATDDGVIILTYLKQVFTENKPQSQPEILEATVTAAKMRIRPALMTSATTLLALLPVLTSTGRGADVMIPMSIPSFGGMLIALLTVFLVPTLFYSLQLRRLKRGTLSLRQSS